MKNKYLMLLIVLLLLVLTGCTVRGGWPRFLRKGEAWGWNGPKPDKAAAPRAPQPGTNVVVDYEGKTK